MIQGRGEQKPPHQTFPLCFEEEKEECQGAFPSLINFFPFCDMQHRLNWQRKHLGLNPLLSTPCQTTRIHHLLSYVTTSHTSKPAASSLSLCTLLIIYLCPPLGSQQDTKLHTQTESEKLPLLTLSHSV